MKRTLVLAVGLLALWADPAAAQNVYPYTRPNYGPFYRPQLSPYLNFLRGGDPATNYFLGVLPEFSRRQNDRIFRSDIRALELGALTPPATEDDADLLRPLMTTGHPTAFNNTAGYFNNQMPYGTGRPGTPGTPARPGTTAPPPRKGR